MQCILYTSYTSVYSLAQPLSDFKFFFLHHHAFWDLPSVWLCVILYHCTVRQQSALIPGAKLSPFNPAVSACFRAGTMARPEPLLTLHQIRTSSENRHRVSWAFLSALHKELFVCPAIFVAYMGQHCSDARVQDACCLLDCRRQWSPAPNWILSGRGFD